MQYTPTPFHWSFPTTFKTSATNSLMKLRSIRSMQIIPAVKSAPGSPPFHLWHHYSTCYNILNVLTFNTVTSWDHDMKFHSLSDGSLYSRCLAKESELLLLHMCMWSLVNVDVQKSDYGTCWKYSFCSCEKQTNKKKTRGFKTSPNWKYMCHKSKIPLCDLTILRFSAAFEYTCSIVSTG